MKKKVKMVTTKTQLPQDLREWANTEAEKQGLTISAYIRQMLAKKRQEGK